MQASHHVFDLAAYVRLEQETGAKHEYFAGHVWAMGGGSREHALYSMNIGVLLANALRGKRWAAHSSDLRVVAPTGLRTYADATVICGRAEFDPDDSSKQSVTNPRVLVEVLSPSTEDYDRGVKLGHYKQIPSVQEVVFVAHDRREVEVVRRERDGGWSRHIARDGEPMHLTSLSCKIPVAEIYRDPLIAPNKVSARRRATKSAARQRRSSS